MSIRSNMQIGIVYSSIVEQIKSGKWKEDSFNSLALELYDLHSKYNTTYQKYAIGPVDHWTKIPLMPISEYKNSDVGIRMETLMPFPGIEFYSSGTTSNSKSVHRMYDTELYRLSILEGFKLVDQSVIPGYRVVLLTPVLSGSSLFYMMQAIASVHDSRGTIEFFDRMNDIVAVEELVHSLKEETVPVLLFGTSLAFYDLMSTISSHQLSNTPVELPQGSLVIETGGWKGRNIEISPAESTRRILNFFTNTAPVREYSMSEISSQLYSFGKPEEEVVYKNPEWLKVRIVDPLTQEDVSEGESGVIGFIDLANIWSCPFVLTEDVGHHYTNGCLVLEGRVVDAPEKGCSLTYVQEMDS